MALLAFLAETSSFTLPFVSQRRINPSLPVLNRSPDNVDDGLFESRDEQWDLQDYENWRRKFGKGDFDPKRFEHFKINHASLMKRNEAERRAARSAGRPDPIPRQLNEYADYSAEEYDAILTSVVQTTASPSHEEPEKPKTVRTFRGSKQIRNSTKTKESPISHSCC